MGSKSNPLAQQAVRFLSASSSDPPASSPPPSSSLTVAYLDLAKAKLSALVVTTTAAGFVAAGGPLSSQLDVLAACLVGTALCSSGAAAMNQIIEVPNDSKMKRTQHRPLITKVLSPAHAKAAATLWSVSGATILWVGTDPVTAALGVGNIALYAGLYTWMKQRSVYNTWVGALVGAVPPMMGYAAATGGAGLLDVDSLVLGCTLWCWQLPHFFSLSYCNRIDYKRGGFQMVSTVEQDGEQTAELIVKYTWYLSTVPILSTLSGVTSSMFALEGMALNAYALHVAHRFNRDRTNQNARKVFLTSLWYLPSLLMLFLLHSKKWDDEKQDDVLATAIWDGIHNVRQRGKELCLHEVVIQKTEHGEEACPVTVGQQKGREGLETAAHVVATTERIPATVDESVTTTNKR